MLFPRSPRAVTHHPGNWKPLQSHVLTREDVVQGPHACIHQALSVAHQALFSALGAPQGQTDSLLGRPWPRQHPQRDSCFPQSCSMEPPGPWLPAHGANRASQGQVGLPADTAPLSARRGDWLLSFVYRTSSVKLRVAGLQPVQLRDRRVENVDLSSVVSTAYPPLGSASAS